MMSKWKEGWKEWEGWEGEGLCSVGGWRECYRASEGDRSPHKYGGGAIEGGVVLGAGGGVR